MTTVTRGINVSSQLHQDFDNFWMSVLHGQIHRSILIQLVWLINHPLPFIRTEDYFGPDRRRKNVGPPEGVGERRADELKQIKQAS